nr:hypothetical protein [Qaidamihabitans albus]
MPIDFSKINTGVSTALIEPRDIFASLPNKPWPRLRVEQDQVLKRWFDRRNEREVDAEPINVVVLVPSDRTAQAWVSYAAHTLHVGDMKEIVDRLSKCEHIGLIVLVSARSRWWWDSRRRSATHNEREASPRAHAHSPSR